MQDITRQVTLILKQYNIKKAALFGSYARGDFDEKSDIDILIQPPKGMGIEFISLKHELEDKLGKKVDLVSYNGINKYRKPYILKYQKLIL